jgi:hypothetical protein
MAMAEKLSIEPDTFTVDVQWPSEPELTVPAYYLVEWFAQNWWSFLYEPRKDDRSDADSEFRSRHWMGIPRNGFALPDLMFAPSGETMEVISRQAYLRFAHLSFTEALDKVSYEIGVASTIVRLQARNNGYRILEAA